MVPLLHPANGAWRITRPFVRKRSGRYSFRLLNNDFRAEKSRDDTSCFAIECICAQKFPFREFYGILTSIIGELGKPRIEGSFRLVLLCRAAGPSRIGMTVQRILRRPEDTEPKNTLILAPRAISSSMP
jgi:hypothetical protein